MYSNITNENLESHLPILSNQTDKNHFVEYTKIVSGKTLQHLLLIRRMFPPTAKFGCYIHVIIIMFF